MKSLKELFRIGRGPSSSHTMGPCRAAEIIRQDFPDAAHFEVSLYGSLAATGKGHFTDRAICQVLTEEKTTFSWHPEIVLPQHPNGMKFSVYDGRGKLLASRTCYSIGGGAISEDGTAEKTKEVYPFRDMAHIMDYCVRNGKVLWQLAEEFEGAEIWDFLETAFNRMMQTLAEGLDKEGVLPGECHLPRKARTFYHRAMALRPEFRRTGLIAAYAYAVSEENAALGVVVTAPTCGSCGIIPAVLKYMASRSVKKKNLLQALAAAGLVGNVVKQNGSIAGAEVGCQGEVGVACAMAAAATAQLLAGSVYQIEYAAEIGLEHFLGLTCDPVCGQVQIPCIERNAVAATRAVAAAELAMLSDGRHLVSFDSVVRTMLETGHDLPSLYRETAMGGLSKYALGGSSLKKS